MRRSDAAAMLAWTALGVLLWEWGFSPGAFHANDSYDYAQMGRELLRGHGFSTLQAFPRHLAFFRERGLLDAEHWPNLYRYPLPTILHALAQALAPDFAWAGVLQTGLWYVLSIPLFFGLARRFITPGVGAALTLVFATDPLIRVSGYNGHTEALAIFLLLAAVALSLEAHRGWAHRTALGVVCGLAYLNRTPAALLTPMVLALVATRAPAGQRLRRMAPVVLAAGLTVLPWALRDIAVVGSPLFSLNSTRNLLKQGRPDIDMMLHAPTALGDLLARHGGEIRGHFLQYARRAWWASDWFKMFPPPIYVPLLGVWILASPVGRRDRSEFDAFKRTALALFVASFLVHCLTVRNPRLYATTRPLLLLAGAGSVMELAPRALPSVTAWMRRLLTTTLVVAAAHQAWAAPRPDPTTLQELHRGVARKLEPVCARLSPGRVVASDQSAALALYCGRRSIRLPWDPAELLEIDARYLPIDYVYVSPRMQRARGTNPRKNLLYHGYVDSGFLQGREFAARYHPLARTPEGGVLYRRVDSATPPP